MPLVARVSMAGPPADEPEDYMLSSLSVIFSDTTTQHGDNDHGVLYTSPHLPEPLHLSLTDPLYESNRKLFSHFVWNSSLLLAKLVEAGTLEGEGRSRAGLVVAVAGEPAGDAGGAFEDSVVSEYCAVTDFDITGLSCIEMGAGTALPSILAALLGASRVTITDYPSDAVLDNLRANVARNVKRSPRPPPLSSQSPSSQSLSSPSPLPLPSPSKNPISEAIVTVDGHEWGVFDNLDLAEEGRHAYDRVFVCDCLWLHFQHDDLRESIDWFLKEEGEAAQGDSSTTPVSSPRCWVVAGFDTGRRHAAAFFDRQALAAFGLEVEAIWERDCNDVERPWCDDGGTEDSKELDGWMVVAILRRRSREE